MCAQVNLTATCMRDQSQEAENKGLRGGFREPYQSDSGFGDVERSILIHDKETMVVYTRMKVGHGGVVPSVPGPGGAGHTGRSPLSRFHRQKKCQPEAIIPP
jgi:hypothetical protein